MAIENEKLSSENADISKQINEITPESI